MKHFGQYRLGILVALLLVVVTGCGPVAKSADTAAPTAKPMSAEVATAATAPVVATAATAPVVATAGQQPSQGGTLTISTSAEPSKIDPHRTSTLDALLPMKQACETLVNRSLDGQFVPGLATSWQASSDGLAYTLKLRQNVKFHDGTSFDAKAVKYNLDRIKDPAIMSERAANLLGPYLSTEVVDDYTAVVHLKSTFGPFLDGLTDASVCMVSPTEAAKYGPDDFQDHFVGTGPFVFKEWRRSEYIRLEKNPNYWGGPESAGHHGTAYLDALIFKFITEAGVRSGTLETGEVQVTTDVAAVEVKRLSENPKVKVLAMTPPGTPVVLEFNVSKAPTNDLKVRQAINYAIDQKALSDTLYMGVHGPAYGPLTPASMFYWSGVEQMYPFDQTKAKALLEEAGWKVNPSTEIREKGGEPLRLDFVIHAAFPRLRDPAPVVQAQLREVGIDVNVISYPSAAWLEAGRKGNQHIGIMLWDLRDPGFDMDILYNSKNASAFAWTRHSNSKLDELVAAGLAAVDPEKRAATYQDIQKLIMDEAMIKPLNVWSRVWGVRKEVEGFNVPSYDPTLFSAFDVYLQR